MRRARDPTAGRAGASAPECEALIRIRRRRGVRARSPHQILQVPGLPADLVDRRRQIGSLSGRGEPGRRRLGRAGECGRPGRGDE